MTDDGLGDARSHRRWPATRVALAAVEAFVALSAIGGGIALAAGLESERFPLAWLDGTSFSDYVLPGALLAVTVGGSAAAALVLLLVRPAAGAAASVAAGLVLGGWILGEILLLTADGVLVSPTEAVYLVLAVVAIVLGTLSRRADRGAQRQAQAPSRRSARCTMIAGHTIALPTATAYPRGESAEPAK